MVQEIRIPITSQPTFTLEDPVCSTSATPVWYSIKNNAVINTQDQWAPRKDKAWSYLPQTEDYVFFDRPLDGDNMFKFRLEDVDWENNKTCRIVHFSGKEISNAGGHSTYSRFVNSGLGTIMKIIPKGNNYLIRVAGTGNDYQHMWINYTYSCIANYGDPNDAGSHYVFYKIT